MKVLAIDLSSARGSVAVADGDKVLAASSFACERGRGAGVFGVLQELRATWRDADRIAIGVGPGSYNGLRAACALAQSIQMSTGAKLCTAPSPCLLGVDDEHYAVYGDARGGRAYRAEVRDRRLSGEIELLSHEDAAARAGRDNFPAYRVGPLSSLGSLPEAFPEAAVLALLAGGLEPADPQEVRPIYLKPPHITLSRAART